MIPLVPRMGIDYVPAMHRPSLAVAMIAATATTYADLKKEPFAKTDAGESVERVTITNKNSLILRVITWGATITEVHAPDRAGTLADVTLGFDAADPWLKPHPFFGCIAGRFANRIAKGKFTIDGREFTLATNNGENHLHGGRSGFDKRNWRIVSAEGTTVKLAYSSPDGEEGYPGKLDVTVAYTLTDSNEVRIDYEAVADRPTVLNLTNHAYWNLGHGGDILDHELQLAASKYVPVDAGSIPTGTLAASEGAMDFKKPKRIGKDIGTLASAPGGGFDHNWVIDGWEPGKLAFAGELHDPSSGRVMRVSTTEPGIQFYSGNYLKDVAGKGGRTYGKYAGLCLETQHFPDAPNQPAFPSTVLRPAAVFKSTTVYQFGVR